ncbi:cupin domain-containing protein (plasmid) [Burkholderia gladioli pv. gladioli]|uniref:cupin domain-containing protein n=1 Tax=Burkholderia gladioli TaxID=28095 RepID=UPI0019366AF4|nr:cupin domain-containing protein [Burkholderia gladioli]MDJ1167647.1 cupin domain-containing protein [Burkholderia gladioli pv. gladioli]QPQ88878.1 cupin domain-containing protein [Burkholderia gladioli]
MIDPLAEVVTLLQPGARYSKLVLGAGPWHIRCSDAGQPFYCVVLEGGCRLVVDGHDPIELRSEDFVLVPEAYGVAMSSSAPCSADFPDSSPVAVAPGEFRIGDQDGPADLRMLVGHCSFSSPDSNLLVSLLPRIVHVRGEPRLATLVELIRDEFRERRPAREVKSVLIEIGQILGSFKGKFAIVGGAVPWLLLASEDMPHVGTLDVEVGLDAEALGDGEYATLIGALQGHGYAQREGASAFPTGSPGSLTLSRFRVQQEFC